MKVEPSARGKATSSMGVLLLMLCFFSSGAFYASHAHATAAFSRQLALEFYNLSRAELKVANFIRQGRRSKEIAEVLGLSVRTVEACRNNIRRKLRIKNKKVNLRTYLLSIR